MSTGTSSRFESMKVVATPCEVRVRRRQRYRGVVPDGSFRRLVDGGALSRTRAWGPFRTPPPDAVVLDDEPPEGRGSEAPAGPGQGRRLRRRMVTIPAMTSSSGRTRLHMRQPFIGRPSRSCERDAARDAPARACQPAPDLRTRRHPTRTRTALTGIGATPCTDVPGDPHL